MNEDHLPSLSEKEKEEIQKEAEGEYPAVTLEATGFLSGTVTGVYEFQRASYIAGASLQLRRAKKREAELFTADQVIDAIKKHWLSEFEKLEDGTERDGYFVAGFVHEALIRRKVEKP